MCEISELLVVYHLQKVSGKTVWKVNGTELFVSFSVENSRELRKIWKGSPVFPEGVFQRESRVLFVKTHIWYKFQAFAALCSVKWTDLFKRETQLQNELYQPWLFLTRFPKLLSIWKHNTQYYGNSLWLQTRISTLSRFQSLSSNCTVLHPPC